MTVQLSTAARNRALDAIYDTELGNTPVLKIRTGAQPANVAAADSGTVLVSITAPADAFADAASGSKTKNGTWQDSAADATGTAGHWRLYKSDGTTPVAQGSATITGGGGDMTLDNTSIATGQVVTVTAFTPTAGGA